MKFLFPHFYKNIPPQILKPIQKWFSLFCVAFLFLLVSWGYALFCVGKDVEQGNIYRIIYVHVPVAWCAFFWVFSAFVFGILTFIYSKKQIIYDRSCHAANILSALFSFLVLLTGSVWGRPTWGVWWDWDPRLTSSLIMFILCCAYLILRHLSNDPRQNRKMGSFIAILNGINVPLVYSSVNLWRSLHQPQTFIQKTHNSSLDIELTLLVSTVTLFLLSITLYKIIRFAISVQENLEIARENQQ